MENIRTVLWEDVFLRDSVKISSKADTNNRMNSERLPSGKNSGLAELQ